jgi:hypothetical protein
MDGIRALNTWPGNGHTLYPRAIALYLLQYNAMQQSFVSVKSWIRPDMDACACDSLNTNFGEWSDDNRETVSTTAFTWSHHPLHYHYQYQLLDRQTDTDIPSTFARSWLKISFSTFFPKNFGANANISSRSIYITQTPNSQFSVMHHA